MAEYTDGADGGNVGKGQMKGWGPDRRSANND